MADAIRALDADGDLCAELAHKGLARAEFFSMKRYSERLADLYGGILGTATGQDSTPARRISDIG
jgi:hypothetical protein